MSRERFSLTTIRSTFVLDEAGKVQFTRQQILDGQPGQTNVLQLVLANDDLRLLAHFALRQCQALQADQCFAQKYARELQHARW